MMGLQVRKNTFYPEVSGHHYLVVGRRTEHGWSARVACSTRREAYYVKARMLAGLDAFPEGDYVDAGTMIVDTDGAWPAEEE